jgi:peptidoglycan hydrolase-like protein with peptidoglycan-binding domain
LCHRTVGKQVAQILLGNIPQEDRMNAVSVALALVIATVVPAVAADAPDRLGPRPVASEDDAVVEAPGEAELNATVIRLAQDQLKAAGFDPGGGTGRLDSQTREALRQYQRATGLPVTGKLDQPTRALLLSLSDTIRA